MPGRDTAPGDGGIQQGVGHRRQWCPGDGAPLEENGVEKSLVLHEMVVLQETVDSGDGGAQDTTVLCAHGSQGTLVLQNVAQGEYEDRPLSGIARKDWLLKVYFIRNPLLKTQL